MTPIEVTRRMLGHLGLSEHEMVQIRDLVDIQADVVVRGFMERHGERYEQLRNGGDSSRSLSEISGDGLVSDTAQQK